MNLNPPFSHKLFALFLIGLFTTSCKSIPKKDNDGTTSTVMYLMGNARRTTDLKSGREIKVGDVVESGTVLQTAVSSYVILSLGEKTKSPMTIMNGGLFDPEIRPANLLELGSSSIVQLQQVPNRAPSKAKKQVLLKLYNGGIKGNVMSNTTYCITLTNGVFMMQSGTFWINSTGSAHVFEGQGEIRLPSKGVTNVLTAESQFDSETGKVTVFDNTLSKEERHNLWLPSDPLFVGWATPKVITPESLDRFRTPNRPF